MTLDYVRGGPKGLGYIQSPKDATRVRFGFGASRFASTSQSAASLFPYLPTVYDQGQTGSCVGHGTSTALWAAAHAKNSPLDFIPSMKGIYTVARELARADATVLLEDGGTDPAQALLGIRDVGFRAMGQRPADGRFSDCDPFFINQEDSVEDLTADYAHRHFGDYIISMDRVNAVKAAIASGMPVGVGFYVDSTFQAYGIGSRPIDSPNFNDPTGGGHWVCAYAYKTDPVTGAVMFTVRNSWSDLWGLNGDFQATENWLLGAYELIAFAG